MNFAQSVLDSLEEEVVVLDDLGFILLVNKSWSKFALENEGGEFWAKPIGANYLEVCRKSSLSTIDQCAELVLEMFEKICLGQIESFQLEYPCHSPSTKRWFLMRVSKMQEQNRIAISHSNITDRVNAEERTKTLNLELEKKILEKTERIEKINISLHIKMAEIIRKDAILMEKEKEIKQALLAEKEANELKTKFITIISHEIRTPLTNINLSSEILFEYEKSLDETFKRKYLEDIPKACKRITQILDQFFFVSQVDAKDKNLKLTPFSFQDIWQDVLFDLEYMNWDAEQRIQIIGSDRIIDPIEMDIFLIKHILSNLLSNSLKYSDPNTNIILELRLESDEILFCVKDSGIGILEEDKHKIFDPFYRGQNIGNKAGVGLGLYIVKQALNLCNGKVNFTSLENKGTEFRISIPILKRT